MQRIGQIFFCFFLITTFIFPSVTLASEQSNIPILCYHNLNPTKPGSMNLTPKKFEEQMEWLKDNGFTVIPLAEAVEFLQGKRSSLPEKSVVITADDGWESVYKYMYPIVKEYNIPVTLFIYPQTISEGKNAMTWDQLKELQQTGLFDIQGHTYDHPNFKQTKKHISSEKFEKYVNSQLVKSKKILEEKMGAKITLLAWPFGIYNDYLEQQAQDAGYDMAFSIDAKPANKRYRSMAQPRYLIVADQSMKTFASIVNTAKTK
jgi:peptidoglycan/xylan/chitin deacetylase (PgdA/CDA1 family)